MPPRLFGAVPHGKSLTSKWYMHLAIFHPCAICCFFLTRTKNRNGWSKFGENSEVMGTKTEAPPPSPQSGAQASGDSVNMSVPSGGGHAGSGKMSHADPTMEFFNTIKPTPRLPLGPKM